jgi:hypothetical protein
MQPANAGYDYATTSHDKREPTLQPAFVGYPRLGLPTVAHDVRRGRSMTMR